VHRGRNNTLHLKQKTSVSFSIIVNPSNFACVKLEISAPFLFKFATHHIILKIERHVNLPTRVVAKAATSGVKSVIVQGWTNLKFEARDKDIHGYMEGGGVIGDLTLLGTATSLKKPI
jgi:hypothetical protein